MEQQKNHADDYANYIASMCSYYKKMIDEYDAFHLQHAFDEAIRIKASVDAENFAELRAFVSKYKDDAENYGSAFLQIIRTLSQYLQKQGHGVAYQGH